MAADAYRPTHQPCHPLRKLPQVVVELLDVVRAHPQHGIGVLADLGERDPAPRLAFGLQLFVANFLGFGHLGHLAECNQTSWGSTSTTTARSAFRIAGAAADELARPRCELAWSRVFATSWAR